VRVAALAGEFEEPEDRECVQASVVEEVVKRHRFVERAYLWVAGKIRLTFVVRVHVLMMGKAGVFERAVIEHVESVQCGQVSFDRSDPRLGAKPGARRPDGASCAFRIKDGTSGSDKRVAIQAPCSGSVQDRVDQLCAISPGHVWTIGKLLGDSPGGFARGTLGGCAVGGSVGV
jgi:hypothetical protein